MLYDSTGFAGTHLGAKGNELRRGRYSEVTPKTSKKAYLALLEHLLDSIRCQTTPVCPSSALPDEITEHGTIVLAFRYVDSPKSRRRELHEMPKTVQG